MPGQIILLRHGETEWSRSGQHTGRTDLPLTEHGEQQARTLAGRFAEHPPVLVLASPKQRAQRTAELAGLRVDRIEDDLVEWDYGEFEGLTTSTIRETWPGWTVWNGPVPGGETIEQVAARANKVLQSVTPALERGDVVLVGHGHALRVLTACWLGLEPQAGALFVLDAGSVSLLGHEREVRVLKGLNSPA
jgi:broad specificity phosphatase PhoE